MEPEQLHDLIERYLSGQLSTEESADFEKLMGSDAELKETVAQEKILMGGIRAEGRLELKAKLDTYHEELFSDLETLNPEPEAKVQPLNTGTPRRSPWIYVAAAAGICLLISFGIVLSPDPQPSILASGSIPVDYRGDDSQAGWVPEEDAAMPIKILKSSKKLSCFRFQDTLELILIEPCLLSELTYIQVSNGTYSGDFVQIRDKTYKVYKTKEEEELEEASIPSE